MTNDLYQVPHLYPVVVHSTSLGRISFLIQVCVGTIELDEAVASDRPKVPAESKPQEAAIDPTNINEAVKNFKDPLDLMKILRKKFLNKTLTLMNYYESFNHNNVFDVKDDSLNEANETKPFGKSFVYLYFHRTLEPT